MKRFATALLLVLLASTAHATDIWKTMSPQLRGDALRQAVPTVTPDEPWVLPDGEIDLGSREFILPQGKPGAELVIRSQTPRGAHLKDASRWRYPAYIKDPINPKEPWINPATGKPQLMMMTDPLTGAIVPVDRGASSAFITGDSVTLDGLVLESTCEINRQSALFGPGFDSDKPRRVTFRNNLLLAGAWGGYLWHCDGDEFVFEGGNEMLVANIGVVMGRSSGFNAQIVRIRPGVVNGRTLAGLTIRHDPNRTTQGGSTTNALDGGSHGIAVRGGQLYADGLVVFGLGQADGRGPMLAAITDHLEGGSRHSYIAVNNLTSKLTPGAGTKIVSDIDIQIIGTGTSTTGNVVIGGKGSASNGGLVVRRPQ